MKTTRLLTLILATALLARADVLPPAQDSSSLKGKLTPVTGKATTLAVSATRKGYVLFNIASLPQDVVAADIVNARLRVYFVSAKKPGDIGIHTVTAGWNETASALEPGVSVSPVAMFPAATVVGKKFVEVEVTATVQAWLTTSSSNNGFAFVASGLTNVLIGSKEGSGTGYPCELDIEIQRNTTPTDGSITGAQLADSTITNAKLASASISITVGGGLSGGGSVALGENVNVSFGSNLTLGGTTSGTFSGDGSGLTNLSVSNAIADESITNTKLANSALTVTAGSGLSGGGAVALGGNVTISLGSNLTLGGTTTFSGTALLPAGTATVAPLRLQSGVNLTTPVFGAVEFDGTNLYLTNNSGSPTRKTLAFTDTTIGTEQLNDGSVTTAKLAGSILPQLLSSSSAPFPANANNAGTVYFNSANKRLYFSDGTSWLPVGNSQAVYRWALWSTYNEASGWFFNNGDSGDNNLTGGIIPSVWSDGNGMANQISSDKNVQAALFNKKAAISPSSVVWSETWLGYSSTNSKFAGALFRVRKKTGAPINWTLQYYATAYGGWGERASIALNGVSVWNTTGDSTASSIYSLVMSIPANRISTVICVAGASPGYGIGSAFVRSTLLAFRNNCLTLPDGLEFVDDLDTATGGYEQ